MADIVDLSRQDAEGEPRLREALDNEVTSISSDGEFERKTAARARSRLHRHRLTVALGLGLGSLAAVAIVLTAVTLPELAQENDGIRMHVGFPATFQ